jgi:sn1-specific diacylglycerol lipase
MTEAGKKWGFDGRHRYAHSGFLLSAMNIRSELENNDLLTHLYSQKKYKDYQLVITGHSLGGGTAVLLSWLLKAVYPSLQCYSFGTPGSVVDDGSSEGKRFSLFVVIFLSFFVPFSV